MYINNNIYNYKNKKLIIILNKIYGINKIQAQYIMQNIGLNPQFVIKNLTPNILKQINIFITKNYIVNKDLQYKTANNIKYKILTNTYMGSRLKIKLPAHGQNTRTNSRTVRML